MDFFGGASGEITRPGKQTVDLMAIEIVELMGFNGI